MKFGLLAVVFPLIVECAKFGLDVSRHLGYSAPTFLTRRSNKLCFRRVKKKSNTTSSNQTPKYDDGSKEKGPYNEPPQQKDASPDSNTINKTPKYDDRSKRKGPYDESPQQKDASPDLNTINDKPKKNKNSYDDGKKRKIEFPSPAPPPPYCEPYPKQMDMHLKKKPAAPEKSYDVKDMNVQYMLDMVNHARGKNPLRLNDKLMMAAKKQADYLASKGGDFLEHTGEGGSMPCNRCNDQKYFPNTCGENIIISHSEEDAMNGWLKSCGHYNNIMDSKYTEFGVWRTGTKWVQVFGEGDSEFNPSITTSCSVQGSGDSSPQIPTYGGGNSSPKIPTYGGSSSSQMSSYGDNSMQGYSPAMDSFFY